MASSIDSNVAKNGFETPGEKSSLGQPFIEQSAGDCKKALTAIKMEVMCDDRQLTIDVLERHYQIEREICEDKIRFLSSQIATEGEAAKQKLRLTLEEKEMQHAHELRCMSLQNELALLRQECVSKERQLKNLVQIARATKENTELYGHTFCDDPTHLGGRKRNWAGRLLTAGQCDGIAEWQGGQWQRQMQCPHPASERKDSRGSTAN